jgi:adenosylcobinamide kinase/adenosylcobinamide-phosphate guanylyltransferase
MTFILGGARSGKSAFAERLASRHSERVAYIATAQALDDEMSERIAKHRQKRPEGWRTLEIHINVGKAISSDPPEAEVIILDCLTLLVSNLLLQASNHPSEHSKLHSNTESSADVESRSNFEYIFPKVENAKTVIDQELDQLQEVIQGSPADWIIVSNEVGMGLVPPYPQGRIYRDLLGWANQRMASMAYQVYFMVAGIPMRLNPDHE